METAESLKTLVREKYGEIAEKASESNGCGCGCSTSDGFSMIGDEYDQVEGYVEDADLKLGCGIPTEHAGIQPGHTVLDLGSGAGLDVFTARAIVGDTGYVIGVDMTPAMIERAKMNAEKLGYTNVEFVLGDIEDMPVASDAIDVIVSNCVLNLVPDKEKAFAEMYRVLKPGAHFTVSDVVVEGVLPAPIQRAAELYVGCVSGAMDKTVYLETIAGAQFKDVEILTERSIPIPEEALQSALTEQQIDAFKQSGVKVLSITIKGVK